MSEIKQSQMKYFDEEPEIKRIEIRTFVELKWMCPVNGCEGEMFSTGDCWATNPLGYFHLCDNCGFASVQRGKKYPMTVVETIDK